MKKAILIWFLISFPAAPILMGQGLRQKMADNYFRGMDYYKAAPIYAELTRKAAGEKNFDNIRRAAICYAKNRMPARAEYFYRQLDAAGHLEKEDRIALVSVLQMQGKYAEADQVALGLGAAVLDSIPAMAANSAFRLELYSDSARYTCRELTINSGMGDFAPAWYDEGIVYASARRNTGFINHRFGRDNSWFLDIYHSHIKDSLYTGKGRLMKSVFRTGAHDGPLTFSADGKEMFITRNRCSKEKSSTLVRVDLYHSQLQNGRWSTPELLPFNETGASTGHAALSPGGDTLWFVSDRENGYGGTDLYYVTRHENTWNHPLNAGAALNTAANEMFPFLSYNGELFFASDGHPGLGGLDLFSARAPYAGTAPVNMGYPLNSAADDFGLILDKTGTKGYFSSGRKDFTDRLYALHIRPFSFFLELQTWALYPEKEELPFTSVRIVNKTSGTEQITETGAGATLQIRLEAGSDYELLAQKKDFSPQGPVQVSTRFLHKSETLHREILLKPLLLDLRIRLLDSLTHETLPGASVSIHDKNGQEFRTLQADSNGYVQIRVPRGEKYTISAIKKGYLENRIIYDAATDLRTGQVDISLAQIVENISFRIDNILYDYGRASLRQESRKELDKLADFLLLNSTIRVELSAHTDARGSDPFNLRLSGERAASCVKYLVEEKGISPARIVSKGYGETRLLNHCRNEVPCSEEEHQQNRRTEIKVLTLQ